MSTQIDAKPKSRPRGNAARRPGKGVKWNNAVGGADEQYQLKKQAVIAEASRTFGRHGYKNVSLDEIAAALNAEGLLSTRGTAFNHRLVHLLRKRWNIATVKINAGAENPPCWPDGTYSVQGAAHALGVTAHTIFAWLKSGRLAGHHLAKGMPWQITLTDEQIPQLQSFRRRTSPSRRQAS